MSHQIKNEQQGIVYEREKHSSMDIVKLHQQGCDVLCPDCKSKLIFITSLQEAREKDPGHPGIFCPESDDHVYITFSLGNSERQKRIIERETTKNEKQKLWEKIELIESEVEELKIQRDKSDSKIKELKSEINEQIRRRRFRKVAPKLVRKVAPKPVRRKRRKIEQSTFKSSKQTTNKE
jgi:hypothetical protein